MSDQQIEQEIQAKGKTAPRVTPADIEANIASEHYFTAADGAKISEHGNTRDYGTLPAPLGLLTFCVLVLRNGHTVTGEAYCQDPSKNDPAVGRASAREVAIEKLWPMVVYAAREKLTLTAASDTDFPLGKACDLSGEGTCEACQ